MKIALLDDKGNIVESIDISRERAARAFWHDVVAAVDSRAMSRGTQINHF